MPKHEVSFQVPERPVGIADIVFRVRSNGELFGRLKVSKGGVVWLPGWKSKGYLLRWQKLDDLAREEGKRGSYPI